MAVHEGVPVVIIGLRNHDQRWLRCLNLCCHALVSEAQIRHAGARLISDGDERFCFRWQEDDFISVEIRLRQCFKRFVVVEENRFLAGGHERQKVRACLPVVNLVGRGDLRHAHEILQSGKVCVGPGVEQRKHVVIFPRSERIKSIHFGRGVQQVAVRAVGQPANQEIILRAGDGGVDKLPFGHG